MSRLRDLGRDTANYFGVGESSGRASAAGQYKESWLSTLVRIVPVLLAAFWLRRVLGLDDDFTGFLATLLLVVVLAAMWGVALRLARRRRRAPWVAGRGRQAAQGCRGVVLMRSMN